MKKDKWIVYKITDINDNVLYIGETSDIVNRYEHHVGDLNAKFYKRTDITITIMKEFIHRKEAFNYQCELQTHYGLLSDREVLTINAKKGAIAKNISFQKLGKRNRIILCFDYFTNNFISEFSSIRKAGRVLNVSNINAVLNGKYKQVGGYYFKYKDLE